jgi:hypothetical protein
MIPTSGYYFMGEYNPTLHNYTARAEVPFYTTSTNVIGVGIVQLKHHRSFSSGVILPSAKICLIPSGSGSSSYSYLAEYDPITYEYSEKTSSPITYRGGVLTPSGKVILIPHAEGPVGEYDPTTETLIETVSPNEGDLAFHGGVLLSSGKVVLVPWDSNYVGELSGGKDVTTSQEFALLSPYLNKY